MGEGWGEVRQFLSFLNAKARGGLRGGTARIFLIYVLRMSSGIFINR